ncbi:MAG: hypothetical protein J6X39_00640 [Bacteroidales bacterium]|nr:hypothetical protein [Bacteroidales bacterium]
MKPDEMPYSILWKGVCWLHTTKSACEARLEASEAVLRGVFWLHPGGKAEIRAENAENGAGRWKNQPIRAENAENGARKAKNPPIGAKNPENGAER